MSEHDVYCGCAHCLPHEHDAPVESAPWAAVANAASLAALTEKAAPVAAPLVEQIAEVLAGHLWHHTRDTHCACGWRSPLAQLAVEGYVGHVASQLARLVAREKASAWDEGVLAEIHNSNGCESGLPYEYAINPYARD